MRKKTLIVGMAVGLGLVSSGAIARADADDWPMYGRGPDRTFSNLASGIRKADVAHLELAWSFTPGDAVTATPVVVDGAVYVGSWDGTFYALSAKDGHVRWSFDVDCQNAVIPVPARCLAPGETPPDRLSSDGGLVTSTALVQDGKVYFAGGKTLYALRASNGRLLWKRVLCGNPDVAGCEHDDADPTRIFSSPVIRHGRLLVGRSVDGAPGYRGGIDAIDPDDGHVVWSFEVDPVVDASGAPVRGPDGRVLAQNRGCGNVWTSASIAGDLAIFGTADCQGLAAGPYTETLLALDARTGALAWTFRANDEANTCDFDFGATANVFSSKKETDLGVGNKNGTYYLLNAKDGSLKWKTNVVYGGQDGGFIGSTATDGQRVFGGTGYGELGAPACDPSNPADSDLQDPSMHAFDLATGAVLWEGYGAYTFAPSAVSSELVFTGTAGLGAFLPASLRIYDKATGDVLLDLAQPGSVSSGVALVGRSMYFGTGDSYDGAGSSIQAWRVHGADR